MNKKFLRLFVLLVCVTSGAGALYAQRVDGCACGIPAQVPSTLIIRHQDPGYQQGALEAANTWNQYVDVFRPSVQTGNFDLQNGINEIFFYDLTKLFGMDGNSTLGITFTFPQGAFGDFNECPMPGGTQCGTFTEGDVLMNSLFPWQLTRPDLGTDGQYYQATATHEMGHALGFHHNWKNVSEMNYMPHFSRYLTRTDVLAARKQFPSRVTQVMDLATYPYVYNESVQTGSGDAGDALSIASVSPAFVAPGGKITIKNWMIENLSNGPVAKAEILFFLSTDTTITASDIYIGGFIFDPQLTSWSQDPDGHEFTVPATTPVGRYYVGAITGYTTNGSNFLTDNITYNNTWFIPTQLSVGTTTTCTPNATTLCALNNRFSVVVNWRDKGTASGKATAIKYADSSTVTTGLFWFSSSDNIEMLVKVLDQCSFNNRFWVFAAAATDLGYDIVVTDLKTGKTNFKPFHNDAGNRAQAINDTGAFVCP